LGRDFAQALLPAEGEEKGVRVTGFVSKASACRPTRSFQFFFLNGRLVKTGTGAAALAEAYSGRIMSGKQPACVLNIIMPEDMADVNVHPSKLEVRFADERKVFHAVYAAVRYPLIGEEESMHIEEPVTSAAAVARVPEIFLRGEVLPVPRQQFNQQTHEVREEPPDIVPVPLPDIAEDEIAVDDNEDFELPEPFVPQKTPRVLCELFETYILIELGDELLLLDKHAAHEKMIYDDLKENRSERYAQQLLAPLPLTLSKEEYGALLEDGELLRQGGFEFTDFEGGTLLLTAAPMELTADEAPAALEELAGELLRHRRDPLPAKLDWLFHSIACRAAIKAGDFTSAYEREIFALKVLSTPQLRHCPHGRPVFLTLTRKELERRFGRLG
jgi:DNA mismatch repair protein MutL